MELKKSNGHMSFISRFCRGAVSAFELVPLTVNNHYRVSDTSSTDVDRLSGDWFKVAGDLSVGMRSYEQQKTQEETT